MPIKIRFAISIIRPAIVSAIILLLLFPAQSAFAGSIVAWGYNLYGQSNIPSPNTGFVAVAGGGYHSLALKQDGSVVAWGWNDDHGQCNVPSPNTDFKAVSAGVAHSLALNQNGSIVVWGDNSLDQRNIPPPNTGFIDVSAGWAHSLGLKQDGSIVAWGYNMYGQCKIPSPNIGFKAVSAGGYHSLGLKNDGSIVAWERNDYGQCNIPSPNTGFIAISAGLFHNLGLKADGSIVAWGAGQPGQSGWPHSGQCNVPSPNTGFIAISAADSYHSLGLKNDGSIVAWGWNDDAQCNVPFPNTGFVAIATGGRHSLALKAGGAGTGMLYGIVRDQQTGAFIAGAEVFVAGMPHLTATSDITGHYEIGGVPYNTLFALVASAAGYETSYTNDVQVTGANPFKRVDIHLTPSASQSLKLIELKPNPNADSMVIMQGGIGHWYYQIVDDAGAPRDGNVTTNLGTTFCSTSKIRPGVVQIDVNAADVSDGQIVRITHLNSVALDSVHQKYFVVDITPLTQSKIWELRSEADLGISNIQVEAEAATDICLVDEQGSDSAPELTSVSRKAILGGGLSASVNIAAYCRINDFEYGGRIDGGGSLTCGKDVRDRFIYAYDTTDLSQNIAKLYTMLYSPPNVLSPELEIIKRGLEAPLVAEYHDMLEAGIYLKGSGWIKGNLGVGSLASLLGLDYQFRGEFGVNAKATGILVFRKNGTVAVAIEVSCDYQQEAGYGKSGLPWSMLPSTLKPFHASESEALYLIRFEAGFSSAGTLSEIDITERWGNPTASGPYNITEEVWTVTGPTDKLTKAIPALGILYLLAHSVGAPEIRVIDFSPAVIRGELEELFCKAQADAGLIIRYERNLLPSQIISESKFELDIGASGLIKLSIGAGTEGRTVETRKLLIETGRVVGTSRYPAESYKEADYTPIDITLGDVCAKALLDVGKPVLQSILYYAEHPVEAGKEVILIARNSILHIRADVLEAGRKIFNVFEAQFGKEMMALAVDSNMPLENKCFGIGGTYRLEPADLNLPAPATFTISYSDTDVGSKDESAFRMYRWNHLTGNWEFIAGTVDIINNTVTASIVRFGTYAIGARVEYGRFTFDVEPNTAPSDGNSIITFASEIVRNNDGTQVADGTLFTLGVSGGTITTADANTSLEGIQIVTNTGILEFALKAPQVGMKVKAEAVSLSRLAVVTGDVNFVDSNAPQPPTGLQAKIVDGKVLLSWNANSEIDLAGYRIYFDDDQSGPPYEGAAYYSGQNSPVDVADANSHILRGLQSGHTYYVSLTAYDVPGNESQFGSEVVFVNTLPPDSDSDGMPDSWEVKYASAANGLLPTADDSMLDNDGDGLTNFEEYMTDNDPLNPDSDEDGVEDSVDMCQTNSRPGLRVDANGCPVGDFDSDGRIGPPDLSRVIAHWLDADCNEPDWCEGTDFDLSTNVNFTDFSDFARAWSLELLEPVMGDFNRNRIVDIEDVAIFAGQWLQICTGPNWCDRCDIDKSSFVDFADFTQSAEHWLEGTSP